jgi:hypothetical protein
MRNKSFESMLITTPGRDIVWTPGKGGLRIIEIERSSRLGKVVQKPENSPKLSCWGEANSFALSVKIIGAAKAAVRICRVSEGPNSTGWVHEEIPENKGEGRW